MAAMEQKILGALLSKKGQGVTKKELAKKISLKRKQKELFLNTIDALIGQERLLEREGRLYDARGLGLVPGVMVKVASTFGFARPDGAEKDVFIPGKGLSGAMPGDKVLLRLSSGRGGDLDEGEVFRITEESTKPFTGVLQVEDGVYTVLPGGAVRFPLPVVRGGVMNARPGDKVLAEIATRGQRGTEHTVRLIKSFGSSLSAAASSLAVLAELDIPIGFSDDAKEQARAISALQGIHPKEIACRLDLRDEIIFTIDGADSKDLDDAVSLKRQGDGWELGVHIADVSHFVTHGSPLDLEALERGTSVYYADSVVPMLPEELSNGVCSLNPGEERLAFSCIITLDSSAAMTGFRFCKSVIRSRVKGVYSELNSLLDGSEDGGLRDKYAEVWDTLSEMKVLAERLIDRRRQEGKLELDSVESKIILDERGEPVDVRPRERGFCERLIEEFMLLANESAAAYASENRLPFVFRVHDSPSPEKLEQLYETLTLMGVSFKKPDKNSLAKGLSDILRDVRDTRCSGVIGALTLRSMAKAKYSVYNSGHFGLSLKNYAHFTSPIRRYPDLAIHRILSASISSMRPENIHRRFSAFVPRASEHSTQREISAVAAERSCEDCYKASYMSRFIGHEFKGVVSGCTAFGAYVQLPNTCEGLVRPADFPPGAWTLSSPIAFSDSGGGSSLRLGDEVTVRLLSANVSAGQINFAII